MKYLKSVLSGFLAFALLLGILPSSVLSVQGWALSDGERIQLTEIDPTFDPRLQDLFVRSDETVGEHQPDDIVRVSIVLEEEPAIEKGYPIKTIGRSKAAANYRGKLEREQGTVTERIEKNVLDGEKLDVVTNLTLVANLISADVKYGQIEEIEKISGVKEVVLERVYEPFEAEEDVLAENDAAVAKAMTEYTGAGVKIAIIDSGVNDSHEAFNAKALNYSLSLSAPDIDKNGTISDDELAKYKKSLGFMTKEDVLAIVKEGKLHATANLENKEVLYRTDKVPFAYNYCDNNVSNIGHSDSAGYHGSHVSGIAAANAYLEKNEQFVKSDKNGGMIGTAPDAQILNMKVMGAGSCTDSTIATAIEDAILLGADVMNLSLGISEVGFSCAGNLYGDILDSVSEKGILVLGAVGNDGSWLSSGKKLYADDVNLSTTTPPSSYAELMGVAWANKNGADGQSAYIEAHSSYGIPSSLMLQPEITAAGTAIYSVEGTTEHGYAPLSGTSMASPDVAGAAAVLNQYVRAAQSGFGGSSFLETAKAQSSAVNKGTLTAGLLMSTADPMKDANGQYYSLLRQGAGLLNTKNASSAKSFIEVADQTRGRVKAEVGDSPKGSNTFNYSFTLHNVSDKDISYTLKTDLFTEDTVVEGDNTYLADRTRKLIGKVGYKIGDKTVTFDSAVNADVDNNGVTDYDDAQAVLDYLSGRLGEDKINKDAANVDKDDTVTTYDAYLILSGIETSSILVKANSSVKVGVTIEITEDLKQTYKCGTYLEGFTFVTPVGGEAVEDVTHSIPILGFCGNWSDPSMFDRNSYIESQNNLNETVPYTLNKSAVYEMNYLEYQDSDGNILRQSTNPFNSKADPISLERLSMGMDDSISSMKLTLIRPAGALCFVVMKKDEDGNRSVLYMDAVKTHVTCIYPTSGRTGWNFYPHTLSVHVPLKTMLENTGVEPGDKIELGAVAVPEYYEKTPGTDITNEYLEELIESGTLGNGAYMTTVVTIDNDAPSVVGEKIIVSEEAQKISFTVQDDQHVAHIGLYSTDGKRCYTSESPKDTDGEYSCTFSTSWLQAGGQYALVVGDYAGNVRMYRFTYGEKLNYQDSKYTLAYVRAGGDRILTGTWVAIEPSRLDYSSYSTSYNGLVPLCYDGESEMLAGAEAVGDYLWQVFEDGLLYVSPITDLSDRTLIADLSAAGVGTVRDLAFNEKDNKLYAVDGTNTVWQIDPMTGDTHSVRKISLEGGEKAQLYGLAIDKTGTAYITCYGETEAKNSLLKLSLSGQDDSSAVTVLDGNMANIKGRYISLTWTDTNRTALYASAAENLGASTWGNYLYKISITDSGCTVDKANPASSTLLHAVRGLVNLSAKPDFTLSYSEVTGINICNKPESIVTGDTILLSAALTPWNATADPAQISWSSDNQQTVSVGKDGKITALQEGKAKIIASYTDDRGKTFSAELDLLVKPAPSIQVSALFREGDGYYYFETFNTSSPNERIKVAEKQTSWVTGTLNHDGNCLYVIDDISGYGYRVDPETFHVEQVHGNLKEGYRHGDAAPGRTEGWLDNYGYLTVVNNELLPLGGTVYGDSGFVDIGRLLTYRADGLPGTAAAIAYERSTENTEEHDKKTGDATETSDLYYMFTEDGTLYHMTMFDDYGVKVERLGQIDGVNLFDVTKMEDASSASMIYDQDMELLVLVSKVKTDTAKVQVIDPKTCSLVMTREFNGGVRQVGILYQYDYSNHSAVRGDAAESGNAGIQVHSDENTVVDEQNHTVTVDVPIEGTTNGLTEVTYKSDVLTFKEAQSALPFHSYNDDKAGTVKFAFADSAPVSEETVRFVFGYEPQDTEQPTVVTIQEREKGDPKDNPDLKTWNESLTIPAKPMEKTLSYIEITSGPSKTEYLEGDTELDVTDIEVTAHYSDGTDKILERSAYTVSGYSSKPGVYDITVSYTEDGVTQTTSFKITVKEKSLTEIRVSKNPTKMTYIEGTAFDPTGMELTLIYDNGTEGTATSGWEIGKYDFSKPGEATVPITYGGKTVSLTVTVIAKSLVGIEVSKLPDNVTYLEGKDDLDVSGGKLTLRYNNGTTEQIDLSKDMVKSEFDNTKVGKQTVEVSYEGFPATFEVTVQAKDIERIEISAQPQKTEYIEETEFDPTGMKITVYYNNGTSTVISGGWELEYDFSTVGEGKVTVSYQGYKAELPVTVKAKTLTDIEVSQMPSKTEYVQGHAFDPTGMVLTLTYDNGTTETVSKGWTLDYDFSKTGTQTVKVTYGGVETSITVTVAEKQTQPSEPQKPVDPQKPADPQQPTDSQKPVDPNTNKKDEDIDNPQTGDDSQIGLWLMLMLLSGGTLAALSVRRKRRQSDSKY